MYKLRDWFEDANNSEEIRIATGFTNERGLKTLLQNVSEETRVRLLVGEILRRGDGSPEITEDEVNLRGMLQLCIPYEACRQLHAKVTTDYTAKRPPGKLV